MRIKNLTLTNFRNYEKETFEFSEGLNVLFGKNAQGKTNCAEAVFYLCTGTSLRIKRDNQLIRQGEERAKLVATAEGRYGQMKLEADVLEHGKELRINDVKVNKTVDFIGNLNAVFFSPGELRLIQDGPDERRRFLDISISQTSKPYYTALMRYRKILDQRNTLLKEKNDSIILETLPIWDEQLCKYAAIIGKARRDYVEKLATFAKEAHLFLTEGAEELFIRMERKYQGDEKEIAEKLFKEMEGRYERDIRLGYTSVGPHRDDLDIRIGELDAKQFASQGQTRTIALAIKLAEVEIFKDLTGETPILILDDVMSELDLPRRKKLVKRIEGLQTILTCTHAERVLYGKEAKKIRISEGHIV